MIATHQARIQQISDEIYARLKTLVRLSMEDTQDDATSITFPDFTLVAITKKYIPGTLSVTYIEDLET